jgi:hypothetical protein
MTARYTPGMSDRPVSVIYRIDRNDRNSLDLYRDGVLVDVDSEADNDSRADIERWGSGVAWAEDYTAVERWKADQPGDDWRALTAVPFRYVTWRSEKMIFWNELDSAGWVIRHVEAAISDPRYHAAASLQEVLSARDSGGIGAVSVYEQTYGVVPETAFTAEVIPDLTAVDGLEFVKRWMAAREGLAARRPSS